MTQDNLGTALADWGERKKDATLICEALEKHFMAWEVLAIDSLDTAKMVVDNAKSAVATLKNTINLAIYETCVAKHVKALKRMGLL